MTGYYNDLWIHYMHSTPSIKESILKGLQRVIGNTPLLEIDFLFNGSKRTIYAKAEHINMTGSIKDRMALHILESAYKDGTLRSGDKIVEATSGNTGISFAALGRALGHPVTIFMPDWMSRERVDLIQSLGATSIPVTRDQGGFKGSIRMAEEMAKREKNVFLPMQFSNRANIRAHELTTGPEIWWQLKFKSLTLDAFVAGVGTGGTVMGVSMFLKSKNSGIHVHPLEPAESPTLTKGNKVGQHRIQGISDEFIPDILDLSELDHVVSVSDGDAIIMAQKLACELGLGIGISSGANFLGALMVQNELGNDAVVATVFSDDNKKYLSTCLLTEEPIKDNYLSPHIELIGFTALKRVCNTCCEMYECTQRID